MSLIQPMIATAGGLNAQSVALSNISNNVAISQTTRFKGIDTPFVDYVTLRRQPYAIVATPQ